MPVDLRGSFNRLYSLVVEQLKVNPLSGHLFVFTNRRHGGENERPFTQTDQNQPASQIDSASPRLSRSHLAADREQ